MHRQHQNDSSNSSIPLLKTCQTCFHAKIRCNRTQDSGLCDRCLRLEKECVFEPARRRHAPPPRSRRGLLEVRADGIRGSEAPSPAATSVFPGGIQASPPHNREELNQACSVQPVIPTFRPSVSWDPIENGLIAPQIAERLLSTFKIKMTSYFPFVVLPDTTTVENMRQEKTCLLLSILAIASFDDYPLQRSISHAFNHFIGVRLAEGNFVSFDVLQGLLVYLAWAHYQPRPRMYSQHLHLATSIVSDIRLDRRRNPNLWQLKDSQSRQESDWSPEELRALIGTYYLATSSSIILQKLCSFPYSSFILESAEKLATEGEYATDVYLRHIVQLQMFHEEFRNITANLTNMTSVDQANVEIIKVRDKLVTFKTNLKLPLSGCPTIILQLSSLELFISQSFLPGFPFGLNRFQKTIQDGQQLLDCLSDSILSAKSVVTFLLTMTAGEEFAMTNIGWIMLSCGLSLAVRLDILARDPRIAHMTRSLLRSFDVRYTLQQVILRLESASSQKDGDNSDGDTFSQLLRRARTIETYYLRQYRVLDNSSPSEMETYEASLISTASAFSNADVAVPSHIDTTMDLSDLALMHDLGMSNDLEDLSVMGHFTDDVDSMSFGPYLSSVNFDALQP